MAPSASSLTLLSSASGNFTPVPTTTAIKSILKPSQVQPRRDSLAVPSRLTVHQNVHVTAGAQAPKAEPRLPFHRSSRQQHRRPEPQPSSTDQENLTSAPLSKHAASMGVHAAKPHLSTGNVAVPTHASLKTPSHKKATAKLGGTAGKVSCATPQRLQQDASTMWTRLRQALARAEGESERLTKMAIQEPFKQGGSQRGNARPSAEVLDMCRRLVAATDDAVKTLHLLFPGASFEDRREGREGNEGGETEKALPQSDATDVGAGRHPSIVEEEEGEEEAMEDGSLEESLEEGEIRESPGHSGGASKGNLAAASETESGAGTSTAEGLTEQDDATERSALQSLVEEVGEQLQQEEEKEERGAGAIVSPDRGGRAGDGIEDETVRKEEAGEAAGKDDGMGKEKVGMVVEEGEASEPGARRPGGRDLESPPSMADLGLSQFTRRFIETAKEGAWGEGKGRESARKESSREADASSQELSPSSPTLPLERGAAAAATGPKTPVIVMPTAQGVREFPSPVFRTGVKLRHPTGSTPGTRPRPNHLGASSHSSSTSSSCRSPNLFEPQSLNKQGLRRSLHAPASLPPSARPSHPPSTRHDDDTELQHHSFVSSSTATPAMQSPSLLQRHASLAGRQCLGQPLSLSSQASGPPRGPSVRPSTSSWAARSNDPTPELTSPAKTPFRVLPSGLDQGAGEDEERDGTPSTARCIRLLQFPPLSAGSKDKVEGTGSGGVKRGKRLSRTPAGAAAVEAGTRDREDREGMMMEEDESFSYNYPDLTRQSASFVFSPNRMVGLGLEAEGGGAGAEGETGPRYYLRSAETKARELAVVRAEEEEAARQAASVRALAAARRSPRLASLDKHGARVSDSAGQSANEGEGKQEIMTRAPSAKPFASSPAVPAASPMPASSTTHTRKSPRIARSTLEREVTAAYQATAKVGSGKRQSLFAADVEAEVEAGPDKAGPQPCRPIPEVPEEEFARAPSFIQIQVTREMLNDAIKVFNSHMKGKQHGGKSGVQALPLDQVTEIIAQGDLSKTILLSLAHLKRVGMSMTTQGQRAYKIWM